MRKKILALLLLLFVLLPAYGCRSAKPAGADALIGTWKDGYGLTEYQFQSGGKMKISALRVGPLKGTFDGTYTTDGNKITIRYRVLVKDVSDTYTFRIDGDSLYLDKNVFKRKK